MNKYRRFFALLLFSFPAFLWSAAPELRHVMPNSWQYLNRLSETEEKRFMADNAGLLEQILAVIDDRGEPFREMGEYFSVEKNLYQCTRVYRETAGDDVFYRLVTGEEQNQNYDGWRKQFVQSLAYNYNGGLLLLAMGVYNQFWPTQNDYRLNYISIDIVRSSGKARGFALSLVEPRFNELEPRQPILVKGQMSGKTLFYYFLMKDVASIKPFGFFANEQGFYYPKGLPHIYIYASDCLVDRQSPLRYGIQSAFDGNPATSYVENTPDDLIKLSMYGFSQEDIVTMSLINGYAANEELYRQNNRVKEITFDYAERLPDGKYEQTAIVKRLLADNVFLPQRIPHVVNVGIQVTALYRGTKYNDTCIAEINFLTKTGWLFGDEQ